MNVNSNTLITTLALSKRGLFPTSEDISCRCYPPSETKETYEEELKRERDDFFDPSKYDLQEVSR